MLYAVSKKELECEQKRSLKDLLLKDKAWYEYFQKHKESLRLEVLETISNILSCGSTLRGYSCYECPKRVSGKGTITYAAIILSKLKPLYGDRFHDKLYFTDWKITLVLLNEQALSE